MIWRVRGTEAFAGFRRGHRASDGPLTVVVVPGPPGRDRGEPPRVAFAIGRKVGPAVTRNRLRRQLREVVGRLPQPEAIGPDDHLVIVRRDAVGLRSAELAEHLSGALRRARMRAGSVGSVPASAEGPCG